jgi:hypothetical protein
LQRQCEAEPPEWYDLPGARIVDVSTFAVVPGEITAGRWAAGGRHTPNWVTTSEASASLRALTCQALGIVSSRILDENDAADCVAEPTTAVAAAAPVRAPGATVCVRLVVNDVVRASEAGQDLAVRMLHAVASQRRVTVLADDFDAVAHVLRVDPALKERIDEKLGLTEREQASLSASAGALISTFDGVCVAAARLGAITIGLVESLQLLTPETLAAINGRGDLPLSIVDGASAELLAPVTDAVDASS